MVLVRDHYQDSAARAGRFLLEAFDSFYYYRPLIQLISRGISLGFGNTNVEMLFYQVNADGKFDDVLTNGPFVWNSFDADQVKEVLDCLSICERVKLEVSRTSKNNDKLIKYSESILYRVTEHQSSSVVRTK